MEPIFVSPTILDKIHRFVVEFFGSLAEVVGLGTYSYSHGHSHGAHAHSHDNKGHYSPLSRTDYRSIHGAGGYSDEEEGGAGKFSSLYYNCYYYYCYYLIIL